MDLLLLLFSSFSIIIILWLLSNIIFAIFSGIFASHRNRSVIGWFFLGALLGPFGLLVLAFPTIETKPTYYPDQILDSLRKRIESGSYSVSGLSLDMKVTEKAVEKEVLNCFKNGKITQEQCEAMLRRPLIDSELPKITT